ncbi:hypothetical protein MMC08_001663 [Hypocenomyce scalaris]|nr:hypothetical protein [Hypocenomyce scalaris]
MAVCRQCCTASGGQLDNPFCQSGASNNLLFCSDPTGAGLTPNDNCLIYQSIPYDATALFPSSIEAFVGDIPDPTGIVIPTAQATSGGIAAPSAATTAGALSATAVNSEAATFTASTVPTTAKSTAGLATLSHNTASAAGSPTASSAGANTVASGTPAPATATAKPNAGNRGLGGSRATVLNLAVVLGLIAAI